MKTHKEKLDYWKEFDPIHYSEMTGDPTGVGGETSIIFESLLIIFFIVIIILITYLGMKLF